jgi:hypothetical protein
MNAVQLNKYFAYLDRLRESGVTNMWGAGRYLQKKFACGSEDALKVLCMWMDSFDGDTKVSERVKKALQQQANGTGND